MRLTTIILLSLVWSAGLLTGCGGGGAKNYNITRATTIGQELKDLKDAYDRGALSQSEYEKTKEKLLKGNEE